MEKSRSQILNNFQTPIPIPCKHYSWAGRFVDICQNIRILLSTIAIQSLNMAIAIRIICAEIKKKTSIIYQIINVFCYF